MLARHWPALLAWFLAGMLGRYVLIELSGWIAAYWRIGGILILPLAALSRLVGFVAMFLVIRDGLRHLGVLAPTPENPLARRRAFLDSLLAGILPFVAVYSAAGLMQDDYLAYVGRALEVSRDQAWQVTANSLEDGGPGLVQMDTGVVGDLGMSGITIAMIVVAFAGRWALKRYRKRLAKAFAVLAVYLETLWVYLTLLLIQNLLDLLMGWVAERRAVGWLIQLRGWLADHAWPVGWVWDRFVWLVDQLGGLTVQPLAWLVVAGVLYGQAVAPQAPQLSGRFADAARERAARLSEGGRKRLGELGAELGSRFSPIAKAFVLMWRAGPVLVGGYVLLYTIALALDPLLHLVITRIAGPRSLAEFWSVGESVVFLLVPLIAEPIRVAVVAAGYDATLARLAPDPPPTEAELAAESEVEPEPEEVGEFFVDHDLDGERPAGIGRHQERNSQIESGGGIVGGTAGT